MFFGRLTDDEIADVDPVTKWYPFLMAATGIACDLATIFLLLKKNTSLLERYREQVVEERIED